MKAEIKILFDRQIDTNVPKNIPIIRDIIVHTTDDNKYRMRFNTCLIEYYKDCVCKFILEDFDTDMKGIEYLMNTVNKIDSIISMNIDNDAVEDSIGRPVPLLIADFELYDEVRTIEDPITTDTVNVNICKFDDNHRFAKYTIDKSILSGYIFNYPMRIIGASISCNDEIEIKINTVTDTNADIEEMQSIIKKICKENALDILKDCNSEDLHIKAIEAVIDEDLLPGTFKE